MYPENLAEAGCTADSDILQHAEMHDKRLQPCLSPFKTVIIILFYFVSRVGSSRVNVYRAKDWVLIQPRPCQMQRMQLVLQGLPHPYVL